LEYSVRSLARIGAEPSRVAALPLGQFVSCNRLSGGALAGKLF
jgi:hypothetical protein